MLLTLKKGQSWSSVKKKVNFTDLKLLWDKRNSWQFFVAFPPPCFFNYHSVPHYLLGGSKPACYSNHIKGHSCPLFVGGLVLPGFDSLGQNLEVCKVQRAKQETFIYWQKKSGTSINKLNLGFFFSFEFRNIMTFEPCLSFFRTSHVVLLC